MFVFTQFATMLILVLAANTGFADFPRLASFQAEDSFMPRQLTKRGHRLVYSNGILVLAGVAAALVIILSASVSKLIPLYAIGVFLSFTLSQLGMARRHLRIKEPGWKLGLLINGTGAIVTAVVTLVISATKFIDGAWVIIVMIPIFVWIVVRLNHHDYSITSPNNVVKHKLIVQAKIISIELDLSNDRPISRFTQVSGAYNHLSH